MSADPEQEYFCEGLAEELIDALARLEGLRVAARTSAFQFGGKGHDLGEIGKKLNVKTVLEGSVRKSSNRLRVNAQLINIEDGYHLWSERYDRDMDDVFAVQDEIAQAVTEKLRVRLLGEQGATMVTRPTDNLEAYNLVLRGRHYFARQAGLDKAVECLTRAVAIDPSYARAHAGLGQIQMMRAVLSSAAPRQVMPEAKTAARTALAIDETVSDAHFALAAVLDFYEWNWTDAEREYRRALELNAGDTLARSLYADLLGRIGRAEEALSEVREAVERDPLSVFGHHILTIKLYNAGRFDEAVTQAYANIELEPTSHPFYQGLGWSLSALGRHDEAVAAFRRGRILEPDDLLTPASLCRELGFAGQSDEAHTIVEDLKRRVETGEYVAGTLMSLAYLGIGNHEQAISWLHTAADQRDALLPYLNVWTLFDPLRADPRFQALLHRMNFPKTPAAG